MKLSELKPCDNFILCRTGEKYTVLVNEKDHWWKQVSVRNRRTKKLATLDPQCKIKLEGDKDV